MCTVATSPVGQVLDQLRVEGGGRAAQSEPLMEVRDHWLTPTDVATRPATTSSCRVGNAALNAAWSSVCSTCNKTEPSGLASLTPTDSTPLYAASIQRAA